MSEQNNSENLKIGGEEAADKLEYIMKSGSVISKGENSTIHCLTIIF